MVIPITMLTALRLTWLIPGNHQLPYLESLRLILAASVMNMVMPSKMGDVVKSIFMVKKNGLTQAQSLSLVMFEKISDLLALVFWCVFGLFIYQTDQLVFFMLTPFVFIGLTLGTLMLVSIRFVKFIFKIASSVSPKIIKGKIYKLEKGWLEMNRHIFEYKIRFAGIMGYSIFLWFLHLGQIWLFIKALNLAVPLIQEFYFLSF